MSTFHEIHRNGLRPNRPLRKGEYWSVALCEPIKRLSEIDPNECSYFVNFTLDENGTSLIPATQRDRELIADWEKRHKDTPKQRFFLDLG